MKKLLSTVSIVCVIVMALFQTAIGENFYPDVKVYLNSWQKIHKPLNQFCLSTNNWCGQTNSPFPQAAYIASEYSSLYGMGQFLKTNKTYGHSGPSQNLVQITDAWYGEVGTTGVGNRYTYTYRNGGATTNFEILTLSMGLEVNERYGAGSLTRNIVNPTYNYVNKASLTESHVAKARSLFGSSKHTFTYRIYFHAIEGTLDEEGELSLGATIPFNECTSAAGSVYDGSSYAPFSGYIRVKFDGSQWWPPQTKVITISTSRAFYLILWDKVVLESVEDKVSEDQAFLQYKIGEDQALLQF